MTHKKYRPYLKAAKAHGARIEHGSRHLKVYDGAELVVVLPYGRKQFEGPGDLAMLRKLWRARGWL